MVLSFTAFLSYSFISCIKDIDIPSLYMLGNTLYTLPYLIIFFIFFTFECCYKLNRYYEPICVTKKGMRSVYKNQLQSIFLYDLLLFAEALLFNVIYIIANTVFTLFSDTYFSCFDNLLFAVHFVCNIYWFFAV